MPGPEVHAAAIATALAGFPLDEAPGWLDWLLIVVLGAVAPVVGVPLRDRDRPRGGVRRGRRLRRRGA